MHSKEQKPLVSVLVVCYNNQQFIYQTLRSIFDQTYPNIEVLIGDDASENFNSEGLIGWINRYKTPNITKIAVFENKHNIGTVANIENLQKKSRGEFLINIAADDALQNNTIIEDAYNRAIEIGEEAEVVMGQTEMWDFALKNKIDDFTNDEMAKFLQESTLEEIYSECSYHVILPACYLYRCSLLEKIGTLSDKYRYIEDWPTHLRMLKAGVRPYFFKELVFLKHRAGGISHGNALLSQQHFLNYYRELLLVYETEVEPNPEMLSEAHFERAKKYYSDRVRAFYNIHIPKYIALQTEQLNIDKAESVQKNTEDEQNNSMAAEALATKIERAYETAKKHNELKEKLYSFSRKKKVALSFAMFIFALILFVAVTSTAAGNILANLAVLIICVITGSLLSLLVFLNIIFKLQDRE